MSFNDISPEYGKAYTLVEHSSKAFDGYNRFKGIYIGFLPNETLWFSKIDFPEGYVFAVKSNDGEFVLYCHREDKLSETWLSDGDDGPEYPMGISVSRLDRILNINEQNYLSELFARKTELRRAA